MAEVHQRKSTQTKDKTTRERVFIVKTDSITTAESSTGVTLFAAHPDDASCYCATIDTSETEANVFTVTCSYETPDSEDNECEQDPLTCPPVVTWQTEHHEEIFKEDAQARPVVNSLNEPFDPLPVRIKSRIVLTVEFNTQNFDGATALSYDNKINDSPYIGADEETLLSSIEQANLTWHKQIGWYWKVRVKLIYNPDGWKMKIMNVGVNALDPNDSSKKQRITLNGREVSKPVPLDKNSNRPKLPGQAPDFIAFDPYETLDFDSAFGTP